MRLPFRQKKFLLLFSVAMGQLLSQQAIAQTVIDIGDNPYDPQTHDSQFGSTTVSGGNSITLKSSNLTEDFRRGSGDFEQATLAELAAQGKISDEFSVLNSERVQLGPENNAILIPDPITGGKVSIQTYDTSRFEALGNVGDTVVNIYKDVVGEQYINMSIAKVDSSGGQLNVDFGDGGSNHVSAENHLDVAAKQSTLFEIDGSGSEASEINWQGNNRVSFTASAITPPGFTNLTLHNVNTFNGAFVVEDINGNKFNHSVNSLDELATYNEWLIEKLKLGELSGDDYDALFNLAVSNKDATIKYEHLAVDPDDEIFVGWGERVIISAKGEHAIVNIEGKLEGLNASSAVKASDHSKVIIQEGATLGNVNGSTINLSGGATAENNGVVNVNFTVGENGKIDHAGGPANPDIKGVNIGGSSSYANNATGVLNINANTGSKESSGIYLNNTEAASADNSVYQDADGTFYSAGNKGTINVGVRSSAYSGITSGVHIVSEHSNFINEGDIYIGREQQNTAGATANDVNLNQKGLVSGIRVENGGSAVNASDIQIGTKTQNATALYAGNGANTTLINQKGSTITLHDNSGLGVANTNYGMYVQNAGSSGNIYNAGTITLEGINARAIQAVSTGAGTPTHVFTTKDSILNIDGELTGAGMRNYGVWVEGKGAGKATANIDGQINLTGTGAIGVHARGNAEIIVKEDAIPNFASGENQIGFFAYGDGAHITINGTSALEVSTDKSTLFRLENGADFTDDDFTSLDITVSGTSAKGIIGSGKGTKIELADSTFHITGDKGIATIIEGGAIASLDTSTNFTLASAQSTGVLLDGDKYDIDRQKVTSNVANTYMLSQGTVQTDSGAEGVTGYNVKNTATLVHNGVINFTHGGEHTGIFIQNSGSVDNMGTIYVNNGTGIKIAGEGSQLARVGQVTVDDGIAGVQLLDGANLIIAGGSSDVTVKGTAHGVLMDTGAASLGMADTVIKVEGTGNGIENKAEVSNIYLQNSTINMKDGSGIRTAVTIDPASTATINVTGQGTGFNFVKEDGSSLTTGDLTLGAGYKLNISGAGGTGINALTDGGKVITGATVDITNAAGGSALVAGTASSTVNFGKLTSVSTSAPVVDLSNSTKGTTFENQGIIHAASSTNVAIAGSDQDDIILLRDGSIRGDVNTGNGNDTLLYDGTRLEGSITMGTGENHATVIGANLSRTSHITSAAGGSGKSVLLLSDVKASGATLANDDLAKGTNLGSGWNQVVLDNTTFTLTDSLTVDDSAQEAGVHVNPGSTLNAGGGVKPVISGNSANLTVHNRGGVIDLTNGAANFDDQLTIKGNYDSSGGRLRMRTLLNAGGPLAEQQTDRILIEGNVKGSTTIDLTAISTGASDTGIGTDANFNDRVDANEGISIVQVAGESNANAFALQNGYVASGAFAYNLYAFEPGEADADQREVDGSGNQFWDYRLANKMYGTRNALVPQGSSYLSLATGLGYYDMLAIDDMHKRLGELRFQNNAAVREEGLDPYDTQIFVRAIGGDFDYKSNRSTNDYGYDFELKSHAIQVGVNFLNITDDDDNNIRVGAAWTHGSSTIRPDSMEGISNVKTDSDMLGLYGTWQNDDGFYVDGILAASRHRSHVNTFVMNDMNKIRSKGWLASIETGYNYKINEDWAIEPQVQLTYSQNSFKDTVDHDFAVVKFSNYDQLVGRLGARLTRTWINDEGTQYIPYARVNYYHGFSSAPKINISALGSTSGGYNFQGGRYGDSIQVGLGLTIQTKENFSFFIEGDYQQDVSSAGFKGLRGNIGVKWDF